MIEPHAHTFLGAHHDRHAKRTWLVIVLTATMMVVEIIAGVWFGSMALLADGWHMSTHAGALLIAALAYSYARRHQADARFTHGTGKVGELAGFASAIVLGLVALLIAWESVARLMEPVAIDFNQAIAVAVIGLIVNLASAALLHQSEDDHEGHDDGHDHDHDHHHHDHSDHDHPSHGHHGDTNFRAAYLHVIADALTSVFAIVALTAGKFLGYVWLDPVMGIVGALVIARWSVGLMRAAARTLLDMVPSAALREAARERLAKLDAQIVDLHVWTLGPGHFGATAVIVAAKPKPVRVYREALLGIPGVSHVTVEVHDKSVASAA